MRGSNAQLAAIGLWAVAGLVGAAFIAGATWLFSFPPSLSSDDAVYFANGIERFSVLDFSPHFPGYPGFVWLGRAMRLAVGDPPAALQALTTLCALALVPLGAILVWGGTRSAVWALLAAALTLTLPLLPLLALSGLSDAAALALLLVFLVLTPARNACEGGRCFPLAFLAGIALGGALCVRPSYAPIAAPMMFALCLLDRRAGLASALGAALVGVPMFAWIFAQEGMLYVQEGVRFFHGHTTGWGNTAFSDADGRVWWGDTLRANWQSALCLLLFCGVALVMAARWVVLGLGARLLLVGFASAFAWTFLMQNPENMRHLAPVLLFGAFMLAVMPASAVAVVATGCLIVALNISILIGGMAPPPKPAPLSQALVWLNEAATPGLVVTQRGVSFLRHGAERHRVYDLAQPAGAEAGVAEATGAAYRLADRSLGTCRPLIVFPARVPGERPVFVYEASEGRLSPCADE